MTGRWAESFSRSAWVAEKRTSSPARANRPASMATMTGRSKTWLFGAILTMGWRCDGMALPHQVQERTRLVLLHHKTLRRVFLGIGVAQHGHRDRVATSATIRCRRMVAIEFGMWRSGRNGGASGSVTVGNGKFR